MNSFLRILLVEDSPTDALMIDHELQTGGLRPVIHRAETEEEIRAELDNKPDVILADYSLPGFTAIDVLDWYHQSGSDAPFILVSGAIDTETAVTVMRLGASDYILKRNLAALSGSIYRAMEAWRLRRANRLAEEKLAFLARMLDLAHDAIIVCDFECNRIQSWNRGAQKLYGWMTEEVAGSSIERVLHLGDAEVCTMIKSLLRSGEWNTEARRRHRDGREIVVSERATLARDSDGKPKAILFIHQDITERKLAEEHIRYQESLLRETGEVAKIGSWEINVLTGKGYWTPEVSRILGLPADTPADVEKGLSFFRGENRQRIDEAVNAAIKDATPYDMELEVVAADGASKWVRTVGHPVLEKNRVVRVCGTFQDVTVQKRAEVQLREQARLLDLTTDAIFVAEFDSGKIIYWNQGAERMHGWTAEEALGEQAAELLLIHEEDGQEIIQGLQQKGEWSGELRERAKDGREIIVSSRATLVRDESGCPKSVLSIHTDVTERKTLEAQFLRAQRLESVGTLASGVAHDLNNILSPIVLASPLLNADLAPEVRKNLAQTITASARRGVEIVRQVLMFARGLKGQRIPVNCEHLVSEIASIAAETFPKSISITAKSKAGLRLALGDSTQLQQILLNLAINARDAMPHGGSLHITARNFMVDDSFVSMMPEAKVGPHILLQVTDTGVGIPKNIIDKIFDPFFSTKETGKGTGLGLSTVLGIVKNHGGFLTVESEAGQGATFKVFIPAAGQDIALTTEEEEMAVPAGNGELVLLVDDEPNIRTVAEAILQQSGYRVLLAADGTQAIARYVEHLREIKVVITDAVMPFLDGAALVRALRNIDPHVKVIGTSGHDNEMRTSEMKALDLQAFLTKPYDRSTLLLALYEVLQEVRS